VNAIFAIIDVHGDVNIMDSHECGGDSFRFNGALKREKERWRGSLHLSVKSN
jgi:hypothetical protein